MALIIIGVDVIIIIIIIITVFDESFLHWQCFRWLHFPGVRH